MPKPNDDLAQAWAQGYRAALDDFEALLDARIGTLLKNLLVDLRTDCAAIKGAAQRRRLREKLKVQQSPAAGQS